MGTGEGGWREAHLRILPSLTWLPGVLGQLAGRQSEWEEPKKTPRGDSTNTAVREERPGSLGWALLRPPALGLGFLTCKVRSLGRLICGSKVLRL